MENSMAFLQEIFLKATILFSYPISGYICKEHDTTISKKYTHSHCSIIPNRLVKETNRVY